MPPFWFAGLDIHTQTIILAEYRLSNETAKQIKDRKVKNQSAILVRSQERLKNRSAYYDQKNKSKKR
jgi:hypothetical protein